MQTPDIPAALTPRTRYRKAVPPKRRRLSALSNTQSSRAQCDAANPETHAVLAEESSSSWRSPLSSVPPPCNTPVSTALPQIPTPAGRHLLRATASAAHPSKTASPPRDQTDSTSQRPPPFELDSANSAPHPPAPTAAPSLPPQSKCPRTR